MNVRRGDTVLVLAGKDRGKRGTVERVEKTKRGLGVVVPGLNMAKRHLKARSRTQQAGIIDLPVPIHVSNVQVVCPRCNRPTRIGHATLEIANPAHKRAIDDVEVGRQVAGHLRVAFEVDDARAATERAVEAGADLVAPPTRTPWGSLNSRLDAPAGLHVTLFQELGGEEGVPPGVVAEPGARDDPAAGGS